MLSEFTPKSYLYLTSNYTLSSFKKDLVAGITVGVIALPLAMAFAIASGTTPERGLITAIVAGFLISALGGSRVQIGGPTGAFVVLIYEIIQRNGYDGLCLSTLIGGALLILFGLFRLGSVIKFVPYPLITGFTTGIAILIFSSQIKDFFGLNMGAPPIDFVSKWCAYCKAFPSIHIPTTLLAIGTLAFILLIRRFYPKIPWGISAIVVATLAANLLHLPVETVLSKFGELPNQLPWPHIPPLNIPQNSFNEIFMDGVAIALLGGIESLLSAVIGDGMTGGRHKSNCELVSQGIANIFSILFGGIPATGALARTAANVKSGAQTPVAGMIHALTLLIIVLFFSKTASLIPLSALAAILMIVAWNMSEIPHFIYLLKAPKGDVAILLTTFSLTIFVNITVAITLGMILSSFLFMKRMSALSKTTQMKNLFNETTLEDDQESLKHKKDVEVYEIQGPFFFGAADILKDLLINLERPPKTFILRMKDVPFIDASGIYALKEFAKNCQNEKTKLILSEVQPDVAKDLTNYLSIENYPTIDEALSHT